MILVTDKKVQKEKKNRFLSFLSENGLEYRVISNNEKNIYLIESKNPVDPSMFDGFDIVEKILPLDNQYKHQTDVNKKRVVKVGDVLIGGGNFAVMAGPCAVESYTQIFDIAKNIKGASILRGGAFKPRTSPYSFDGLKKKGIDSLVKAGKKTGMPTVSEITEISQLPLFDEVDLLQVGARNMQNFELLRALGKQKKPVLLKRGFSNTINELLSSAEYILDGGNKNVILCERGIRTFENSTRFTLDVSAIAEIHEMTNLPVIADPSHAAGKASLVMPLALACTAAGADGLLIEVHNNPEYAKSDASQAISYEQFENLMTKVNMQREILK